MWKLLLMPLKLLLSPVVLISSKKCYKGFAYPLVHKMSEVLLKR